MNLEKLQSEVNRLVNIMETLRGPQGCPWDKKQNHYSLQPYILEEAYEVVEALQKRDLTALREELGDLLLQVVFQAQIAREKQEFDLGDVFSAISDKLIRRHPHVFGEIKVENAEEVNEVWQDIKDKEKAEKDFTNQSILENISLSQPALNQAYQIQEKAAEVGFDWDEVEDVLAKIEEEVEEVKEAVNLNDQQQIGSELGDILFAVTNLARFYDIDPEIALLKTNLKFKKRFNHIEDRVYDSGKDFEDFTLEELDRYWEEAKIIFDKEE